MASTTIIASTAIACLSRIFFHVQLLPVHLPNFITSTAIACSPHIFFASTAIACSSRTYESRVQLLLVHLAP